MRPFKIGDEVKIVGGRQGKIIGYITFSKIIWKVEFIEENPSLYRAYVFYYHSEDLSHVNFFGDTDFETVSESNICC